MQEQPALGVSLLPHGTVSQQAGAAFQGHPEGPLCPIFMHREMQGLPQPGCVAGGQKYNPKSQRVELSCSKDVFHHCAVLAKGVLDRL